MGFERMKEDERGLVTTELALIFPALLVAILLGAQGVLYGHARNVARASANTGAEAAALVSEMGNEQAAANAAATQILSQASALSNPSITVTLNADSVTVVITGDSPSVVGSWDIAESVTVPLERGGDR